MKRRADGLLQKSIVIDGKRKFFYGKTKSELNKKILAYQEKQADGRTFAEIAEEWADTHYETLAYNSLKSLKPAVTRAIDYFGDKFVKDITAIDVNVFIKEMAKLHYAQKTVTTQLQAIRQILGYGILCGDLRYNVADSVSIPKNLSKEEREPPKPETIQFIKQHPELPFALFALFALYTGARRGEIQALQYKDINKKDGLIHISKSVYYVSNNPYIKEPKTKAGTRDVILIDELSSLIPDGKPNDYIFQENGKILTNKRFETLWKKYTAYLPEHITPHQLRHAYATRLYELDIDVKTAQGQLGHADIKTTADIYTHISKTKLKLAADKMKDF